MRRCVDKVHFGRRRICRAGKGNLRPGAVVEVATACHGQADCAAGRPHALHAMHFLERLRGDLQGSALAHGNAHALVIASHDAR